MNLTGIIRELLLNSQNPTSQTAQAAETWVFGYGSLIWRPDFPFLEQCRALLPGWQRRFWQGSEDHRGTPGAPGRVVTLVRAADQATEGMAFLVSADVLAEVFEKLDYREKNGYHRESVRLLLEDGRHTPAVVYVAAEKNEAWLGEAPLPDMVEQIVRSAGPSGSNVEYVLELARGLRRMEVVDSHVAELESALLNRLRELPDHPDVAQPDNSLHD